MKETVILALKLHIKNKVEMSVQNQKTILKYINKQGKEIERLNNIINGMEKFFKYAYDNEVKPLNDTKISVWTICLDELQELKGDNSNE